LWAGPAVDGLEITTEQTRQANLAAGIPPGAMAANVALERELLTAVRDAPTPEAVGPAVNKVRADHGLPSSPPAEIATLSSAWYRNFLSYDPAPALRALKIPVLAVVGEKDTQVSAEQNIPALRAALSADPKANVTALPGLNHLLQPAKTGLTDEYQAIETTIDPAALKLIVDWVATTTGL
ncbi:MAG: alpha/beta hydrolase, partial [Caulobacteraceae bacterium]|nr:alpha/beta hydrolase [Caulobacteraceae bacterium]